MRALWAAVTPEPAARQRAYSLDSVVEESLYAIGPLAVGLVTAIASPAIALVGTAALNLAATTVMATSRISIEHGRTKLQHHDHGRLGPFRSLPFLVLALAMVGVGVGTGPLEVAIAARTEQAGQSGLAGVLFAIIAIGSVTGGLVWGCLPHRRTLPTQLAVLAALTAVGLVATSLATPIPLLAIALAATGGVTAPIYTVAYVSSDEFAPAAAQTEASTWINTSSNLGIGAGTSIAGFVLDHTNPASTLALAAGPLVVTAVIAVAFLGRTALTQEKAEID